MSSLLRNLYGSKHSTETLNGGDKVRLYINTFNNDSIKITYYNSDAQQVDDKIVFIDVTGTDIGEVIGEFDLSVSSGYISLDVSSYDCIVIDVANTSSENVSVFIGVLKKGVVNG